MMPAAGSTTSTPSIATMPFGASASGPARGLSAAEAAKRLTQYGPNELQREKATSKWRILAGQFASPVIWLLLIAAAISGAFGELVDAIATILIVNALVGFFQEYRAERAVLALRAMTAPQARVVRDGRPAIVAAPDVVPGDVLLLEGGDVVAADAIDRAVPLAEQRGRVFAGTSIAEGTALAEVSATGMRTELGKIAHLLATAEETATPLQTRLARVSKTLMIACGAIVSLVAVVGFIHDQSAFDVFLSVVSLAVAAVPEGLPAVVTIALAVGVQRMAARHVLVRKLHAVETLGCATVICTTRLAR